MAQTSTAPAEANRYGITALDGGLQVLRAVGDHPDLNVPQLAQLTGITKSKVFRIVRTLAEQGFVVMDTQHNLRLGSAALILGRQAEGQFTLTHAAAPTLESLNRETRENTYLLIREGTHAVILDLRRSMHAVRAFTRVGAVVDLHAGGASKVLLAYAPQAVQDEVLNSPLRTFTPHTITDPRVMQQLLQDIRRNAFHTVISDLQEQVFALAAPVFDHHGEVVAAISVAGPMMRFDEERRVRYEFLLRQGSREISQRLGA